MNPGSCSMMGWEEKEQRAKNGVLFEVITADLHFCPLAWKCKHLLGLHCGTSIAPTTQQIGVPPIACGDTSHKIKSQLQQFHEGGK
eukprot:scaffold7564_cov117-Cylindrotheca_fusiformis.AAC.4